MRYAAVAVLLVAASVLLDVAISWAYIAICVGFEGWLRHRMAALGSDAVPAGEPPYHFSDDEARVVGRYRFYFQTPALAQAAASMLSALGLSSLFLAPWLTYKQAFVQAVLIGANLFAVSRLTKRVAPVYALRIAASRGDRDALAMHEAHDSAWVKIRAANAAAAADQSSAA